MKIILLTYLVLLNTASFSQVKVLKSSGPTIKIGDSYEGGKVFYLTTDCKHGLIVETKILGVCAWYDAQDLISNPNNHSEEGKLFVDWRLPTKSELNLLYSNKYIVLGISDLMYWSSTEFCPSNLCIPSAWYQNFSNGVKDFDRKINNISVLAVRAF